ncbi:PspC domain-containing protein [Chloroflexus sp.]|uniref:PspC domain-containing protein n=1 Tax=Chloroflexus sp. TaxID=1904827 RepID=UPI00262A9046|nr:PspC domain-containing protein [uncultured Chloroflexus sp.]
MTTNRLTRSATDSMIGGVCGGLARYFGIDSTIVRLIFVLAVLSGLSPLIYIVLWIIMPKEELPQVTPPMQDPTGEWKYDPYTGQKLR